MTIVLLTGLIFDIAVGIAPQAPGAILCLSHSVDENKIAEIYGSRPLHPCVKQPQEYFAVRFNVTDNGGSGLMIRVCKWKWVSIPASVSHRLHQAQLPARLRVRASGQTLRGDRFYRGLVLGHVDTFLDHLSIFLGLDPC